MNLGFYLIAGELPNSGPDLGGIWLPVTSVASTSRGSLVSRHALHGALDGESFGQDNARRACGAGGDPSCGSPAARGSPALQPEPNRSRGGERPPSPK